MAFTELCVSGAARRLEGPLLFLERTVRVGLNSAVEVIGPDGAARVGRVALIDDERMVVEVLAHGTRVLSEIDGLRLIGTAPEKAGVLSFVVEGVHPQDP